MIQSNEMYLLIILMHTLKEKKITITETSRKEHEKYR